MNISVLALVKRQLGIFYTDPGVDAYVGELIEQARRDLVAAGVPKDMATSEAAHTAIILFCSAAYSTEPKNLGTDLAYIAQVVKLRS